MRYLRYIGFLLLLSVIGKAAAEQPAITFGIPINSKEPMYQAVHQVFLEAFSQLDIQFKSISCAPKNCAHLVSQGIVDGEPGRVEVYGERYSNVIKVNQSLFRGDLILISKPDIEPANSIDGLIDSSLIIAHQQDYVIFQEALDGKVARERLRPVIHWKIGLSLLVSGEADVYIAGKQVEFPEMRENLDGQFKVTDMVGEFATHNFYPFLHARHNKLAGPLSEVISEMKRSGRVAAIMEAHGIPPAAILSD